MSIAKLPAALPPPYGIAIHKRVRICWLGVFLLLSYIVIHTYKYIRMAVYVGLLSKSHRQVVKASGA